jgi:diguanylate cyclase (GGDEF)-like protein/PAS domain S-box-containing protein
MTLDITTLSIALFFISSIQAIVMLFIFRIIQNYPGMNYLLASCFFSATSGLIFAMRSSLLSGSLTILGSNFSSFLAVIALNIGFSRFLGLPLEKKKLFTLMALFLAGFSVFTLGTDNVNCRIIVFCVLIAILSFLNTDILTHHKVDSVRPATRMVAAIHLLYGLFFVVRAVVTLFHETLDFFIPTLFQLLAFFMSIAGILIWSYCFIIMAVQRERSEKDQANERFRLIFETIPDTVFISSLETGEIVEINEKYTEETGYTREETIGKTPMELNLWKNSREREVLVNHIRKQGSCKNIEIHIIAKNGKKISALISSSLMKMDHKKYIISVIRNISKNKELAKKLNTSEETFKAIMEQSPISFMLTDINGDIEYVNQKFLELTGYKEEEVIGQTPRILKSGFQTRKFYQTLWETIISGKQWSGEIRNKKKNGEIMWEHICLTPILDEDGTIMRFLAVQEDISSRKIMEDELRIQARTDMLTGVMNRRYFMENAEKRLFKTRRDHEIVAFLMIDIDRFKDINDSFGHNMGDKAIRIVASQCQKMIKKGDLFGRIGGEEFGALIFSKNHEEYHKIADAIRYGVESIDLLYESEEKIPLRISIGLTVYRPGEDTLETLMHRSDIALYQAKNDGRNRVVLI